MPTFAPSRGASTSCFLCHGMACYVMGSQRLVQNLEDVWGIADGDTTADGELTVQVVNGCLGVCDRRRSASSTPTSSAISRPRRSTGNPRRHRCRRQLAGRASSGRLLGATMTDRLETRADFERFQQAARQRWEALWQGDKLIVSVGVDSSSNPKARPSTGRLSRSAPRAPAPLFGK